MSAPSIAHPLIQALESGRIPSGGFGHERHLHAAWLYLTHFSPGEAIDRCRDTLRSLAEKLGAHDKYNETITWALMLLLLERLDPEVEESWDEYRARCPELFTWNPGILDRYYTKETLRSAEARMRFIWPEKTDG